MRLYTMNGQTFTDFGVAMVYVDAALRQPGMEVEKAETWIEKKFNPDSYVKLHTRRILSNVTELTTVTRL